MSYEPIDIPPPSQDEPPNYGKFFIIAAVVLLLGGTAWSLRGTFIVSIAQDSKYDALEQDLQSTKRRSNVEQEEFDMWDDMEEIDNLPEEEVRVARRKYEADEKRRASKSSKPSNPAPSNNTSNPPANGQSQSPAKSVSSPKAPALSPEEQNALDRQWVTEIFNGPCDGEARPKRCTKLRIKFRCEDRFDDSTENRKSKVRSCRKEHGTHLKEIAEK